MEVVRASSNKEGVAAWQLKDSKACSNILLHCGEKQLISLHPLRLQKQSGIVLNNSMKNQTKQVRFTFTRKHVI
jgi:hypothetical protein